MKKKTLILKSLLRVSLQKLHEQFCLGFYRWRNWQPDIRKYLKNFWSTLIKSLKHCALIRIRSVWHKFRAPKIGPTLLYFVARESTCTSILSPELPLTTGARVSPKRRAGQGLSEAEPVRALLTSSSNTTFRLKFETRREVRVNVSSTARGSSRHVYIKK
jgi:hypothetical protein